jgi:FkbM family methyltransferase
MTKIITRTIHKMRRTFFLTDREREYKRWLRDGGDAKLRFDYPLNSESLVLDVGGFTGQWASDIYARYNCQVWIFEPVPLFANEIKARFMYNPRIKTYNFALGTCSRSESIFLSGDSTSAFASIGHRVAIRYEDVSVFFENQHPKHIDLIKINCEGGEYELLERLLDTGLMKNISNVQVQFHNVSNDSCEQMAKLQRRLSETHRPTYQYRFLWENWQLRNR